MENQHAWKQVTGRRILRLEYVHNGKEMEGRTAAPLRHPSTWEYVPDYDDPKAGEWVVAILENEGGPYLVCTHNRGVVRGEPILVGANEAREIIYFEGYGTVTEDFDDNVVNLDRLMRIHRKRKEQGDDALTPGERAYLAHAAKVMSRIAAQFKKSLEGREAITELGQEIYELLPEDLQERWAHLTPAELTMLSLVFPEQLPADARSVLGQ